MRRKTGSVASVFANVLLLNAMNLFTGRDNDQPNFELLSLRAIQYDRLSLVVFELMDVKIFKIAKSDHIGNRSLSKDTVPLNQDMIEER